MCDGILVSVREDGDLMDPFEEGHESATEPAVVDPAIVAPPDAPVVVDSLVQGLVGVSLGTEALDLPGGSGAAASSSSDAAAMPAASAGGAGSAGGASLGPVGWIKNSDGHVYNQEGRWIGRITTFLATSRSNALFMVRSVPLLGGRPRCPRSRPCIGCGAVNRSCHWLLVRVRASRLMRWSATKR